MLDHLRNKTSIFYLLAFLIIVGGLWYRTVDLTSDPPMYFGGLGQTLSTDPGQYVHHARNAVLYDDADPFDYPRWKVYERSLTSGVAYLWFSIAGVSLKQANLVGVILSTAALIFFVLAVTRHHRPWVAAAVAFGYSINVCLTVYGRQSYLENGLLFITSLLFFIYSRWGDRRWGVIVSSVLTAFAMLTGKLFGALLLPALLLTVFFSAGEHRWKSIAAGLASFVVSSAILVIVLYGTDIGAVIGYFTEQSLGLRGVPAGLSSPWGFVEHLISYGFENRLFFLSLDLVPFLLLGALLVTMQLVDSRGLKWMSPVGRLAMFAVACIVLGLMPLNYSPLRYALFLIPSILVFCFTVLDSSANGEMDRHGSVRYYYLIPLLLLIWHALYQVIGITVYMNDVPIRLLVWSTLPGAIIITLLVRKLLIAGTLRPSRKVIYIALGAVLVFSLGLNIHRTVNWVRFHRTYNFVECGDDLAKILGHGAVVSGPYAPVLTIDNDLKCFIHLFGVAEVDSTLFDRYPVTHLAIDESNWAEAIQQYPVLKEVPTVSGYLIRDYGVHILNISKVFSNPLANRYQETGYERAVAYYARKEFDSAAIELRAFVDERPGSKSAELMMAELLFSASQYEACLNLLDRLAGRFPTDYYTLALCGRLFQMVALRTGDQRVLVRAQRYYEQAVSVNPFRSDYLRKLYDRTAQEYSAPRPAPPTTP